MLVQLKAAGATVALLAATAAVTAVGGAVAVAADRVDPGPATKTSRSPSPSYSYYPTSLLATSDVEPLTDAAAATRALHAPSGYSEGGGDLATATTQVQHGLASTRYFVSPGCKAFVSSQRRLLVACGGAVAEDYSPQSVERRLRGDDATKAVVAGGGVLVGPGQTVDGLQGSIATASRGPNVVLVVVYAAAAVPDDQMAGLAREIVDGFHE